MSVRDGSILLGLAVLVVAFVAYEMAGLSLFGWHTISYFAQHNEWLNVGISLGACAVLVGFLAWWHHHMSVKIPK